MFGNGFLLTFNESLGSAGREVVDLRGEPETSIGFPFLGSDACQIPRIRLLSDSSDQIAVRFLGSDYLSDVMLTWILMPYVIHLLVSHWIFSWYTLALKKINDFCNLNPNTRQWGVCCSENWFQREWRLPSNTLYESHFFW